MKTIFVLITENSIHLLDIPFIRTSKRNGPFEFPQSCISIQAYLDPVYPNGCDSKYSNNNTTTPANINFFKSQICYCPYEFGYKPPQGYLAKLGIVCFIASTFLNGTKKYV
jgi:hypothetical protein